MAYKPLIRKLAPGPDIDILLMGKTGHGKSSSGNSILGRKTFVAMGGDQSVTDKYEVGYTRVDGRVIKVVDIPGLCDTDADSEEDKADLVRRAISGSLRQFPQGLSALVLVLNYTAKFTKEERETIKTLKHLLGEDVLRTHTVCLFTHGRNFEADHGEGEEEFDQWCKERTGPMKDLLQEVDFRCVAFENLVRDPSVRKSQVCQLVSTIDCLLSVSDKYTIDKFSKASDMALKVEKYQRENGMIKDDLDKIRNGPQEEQLDQLQKLKERVESLQNELIDSEEITFENVKASLNSILENINVFKEMIEKEKVLKAEKEKMKAEIARRAQVQKEAFDKMMSDLLTYVDQTEFSLDEEMQKTDFSTRVDTLVKGAGIDCTANNGFFFQ